MNKDNKRWVLKGYLLVNGYGQPLYDDDGRLSIFRLKKDALSDIKRNKHMLKLTGRKRKIIKLNIKYVE